MILCTLHVIKCAGSNFSLICLICCRLSCAHLCKTRQWVVVVSFDAQFEAALAPTNVIRLSETLILCISTIFFHVNVDNCICLKRSYTLILCQGFRVASFVGRD